MEKLGRMRSKVSTSEIQLELEVLRKSQRLRSHKHVEQTTEGKASITARKILVDGEKIGGPKKSARDGGRRHQEKGTGRN